MTGIYEASKARFIRRISADFCRVECNWDNRKWDDLFHYLLFESHLTRQKCDVWTGPKKRGFTDCSIEIFYVDYIEPGQPKKAPLFSELTINYPCFLKANQNLSFREWYSVSFSWERFCQHFNGKRWKVLWGELSIMSTQSSAVMYSADAGQRYTLYHMLVRGVINNLASVCYNQLHLIAKAQTMEYLKNLHKQLFQVTPENVKK